MTRFEYTVIPAPGRADKVRGARTVTDRFSATLAQALNDMAAQGWDYVRAETLPSEEKSGLTSRSTVWHNVLIFRRALAEGHAVEAVRPEPVPMVAPAPVQPVTVADAPAAPVAAAPAPAAHPFSQPMRPAAPDPAAP